MERFLDPELLGLALGQHEALPSPSALSELITKAELGLLQHRPDFDSNLKRSGWYLHAIGSSKYALETYGIERQRAAFQISGHIFDVFLQSQDTTTLEKLKYSFASQVAYLRSQLDPNAIAIYTRASSDLNIDSTLVESSQEIALSCAVALLGMNVDYIYRRTNAVREEINRVIVEWEINNIFDTPFGAAGGVSLATRDLISYLVYGRVENLDRAKELLITSIRSEPSLNDHISRWVAAHLLNLANDLQNASIWTVLPPDIPPNIRKAFSMAHPKVLTLWPPQVQLFSESMSKGINPLSPDVKRLFLSTPTSGGKTLLAQLLIISHLSIAKNSVCYVAPTRSLCREVASSLEKRLRYLGKEIVSGLPEGDWLEDILNIDPEVEVMTPERLSYLLHTNSEQLLQKFGMFIFDEVHTVGELGRGWTLEEDLAYLQYATEGKDQRIVFISAAIGNKVQFVEWLGKNGDNVVPLSSNWRGPRRLYTIWRTEPDWKTSTEELASPRAKYAWRSTYPLYGSLDTLIPHSTELYSYLTPKPVGNLVLKYDPSGNSLGRDNERSTAFYKMLVPLIQHLAVSGPVLVIESTIPRTINTAKAIAAEFNKVESTPISQLMDMVLTKLGAEHSLHEVLSKGVVYHHGSLPHEIRASIEDAVSQGQLNILVATTTMTDGINLPVKSVIIASQGSFTEKGQYEEYITGPKLINAIGRAGRATKETEGIIVLALNKKVSPDDFKRFTPNPSEMQVTSNIATKEALEALAKFEELIRQGEDAIFQANPQTISNFLSFIWYFDSELERLSGLIDDEKLLVFLSKTLAWSQLSENDQKKWFAIAQAVTKVYNKTDTSARRRWASSGTSLGSARELEKIAREVAATIEDHKEPIVPVDAINMILNDERLTRILALPESPQMRVFTTRYGQNREQLLIPIREVIQKWINGEELIAISNSFFGDVVDVDFRFEQLGEFISKYFENFFPWVLGTIVNWTNSILREKGASLGLPRSIPAYIRWGVGNITALELMLHGILSRNLSNRIGTAWEEMKIDTDVHSWLRTMEVDQWRKLFNATMPELRNLVDFVRSRRGGVAVDVITKGQGTIDIDAVATELPLTDAHLARIDKSELSPVGVWVAGDLIGQVASRDQADVSSLLSTGLIIVAKCAISAGKGQLELSLLSPE